MNNPQKTPDAASRGDPNAGSGAFKTPDPAKADSTSDDDSMEWEKLKQEYLKLKKEEKELLESAAELQAQKNDLEEKLGKANASGSRMIKDAVAVVCLNGTELEYVSVPDAELPAVIVADGGILLHSLRERASVWPEGPSTYGLLKSMVDNGDDIRDAFDWAKNVTWIDCLQDATHIAHGDEYLLKFLLEEIRKIVKYIVEVEANMQEASFKYECRSVALLELVLQRVR